MRAMMLLWAAVVACGIAGALSPAMRFPPVLPSSAEAREACIRGLAPLVAKCARGAVLMTLGVAGMLSSSGPEFALPIWGTLTLLGFASSILIRTSRDDLDEALRHVRTCARTSAHTTFGMAAIALVEALVRQSGGRLFLLAAAAVLFAVAMVDSVLSRAAGELVALSTD